ncbi:MAG TPA: APC family permease [Alphaproteobacteria bacterium]|nr:APC family permease [Alphaproteobacteria bacterium]
MAGLERRLGLPAAIGLSLSVIAPTLTAAFNISLAVKAAGAAAPTAFALGTLALLMVAAAFIGFSRRVANTGSAYAYIAEVFGQRAGFVAGWTLLLTYVAFTTAMGALAGSFVGAALGTLGFGMNWLPVVAGLTALVAAGWLAYRDVRLTGRLLLLFEAASLLAILLLCASILRTAPAIPVAALTPAATPQGWSGIGYALVFTVLSFAGFEGAATLGEETANPYRNIPLAILLTIVGAGVFFVFVAYCEVRGFGLERIAELGNSAAPLNDLALRYGSKRFAVLLDIAAAVSSFSGALGALTAAARLLFALGRAGLGEPLGHVHKRHGTPHTAVALCGGCAIGFFLIFGPMIGPADYYAYTSTTGTLALILVYVAVAVAASIWSLRTQTDLWAIASVPGAGVLIWCLVNTIYPSPPFPNNLWPYAVIVWMVLALPTIRLRPKLASPITG